ncbi:hypothetical protein ACLK1T_15895 [Escherichia coli]
MNDKCDRRVFCAGKIRYSVDVAMTGKAALEMFKPGVYDLALLDIQLPG